jgi:hypothetical protein
MTIRSNARLQLRQSLATGILSTIRYTATGVEFGSADAA